MKKYFCVSDIHSYFTELTQALDKKGFEMTDPEHVLIVCGDAFDRGDETVEVFEFLKYMQEHNRLIYISGNHEDLLFDCIKEIANGRTPGSHHFSNGTVKTICMLCGECEWIVYHPDNSMIQNIFDKTEEVRNFIRKNCVDYFELGNKVFVHSWIPCLSDDLNKYHSKKCYTGIYEKWHDNPNEMSASDLIQYRDAWKSARWGNPYKQWHQGLYPENKCIVFGHWHCSEYWGTYKQERKLWPDKNRKDWQKSFYPAVEENIIGIDACCAYSGFINCVVFDEEGNLIDYDK